MKKIQLSFLIGILFILISCQKEQVSNSQQNNSPVPFLKLAKSAEDMDGNINIISNGHTSVTAAPASINIDGYFFNDNDGLALINSFDVNGVNVPQVSTSNKQYAELIGRMPNEIASYNLLTPSFGNTATISVTSSEFPNFTEQVNLPIVIDFANTITEVDTNTDLTIQWNGMNTGSKVGIWVFYDTGISQYEDPNLPSTMVSVVKYVDDHIGQLTIPKQELSSFPVGGYAAIYIGRATQTVIQASNKEILVNGIAHNRLRWLPIL